MAGNDLKPFDDRWLERRGNFYALITPGKASELLVRNTKNRRIKNRAISNYARDMLSGKWNADASDIKFDQDGVLIDGQNRLLACVQADAPFPTLVRTGLDPKARDQVDQGVKRTTADALRMEGVVDQNNIAAAIVLRNRYDILKATGQPIVTSYGIAAITHQEALDYLAEHPMLEKMRSLGDGMYRTVPTVQRSIFMAFASMIAEMDEEAARHFAAAYIAGEVSGAQDPVMALTRYVAKAKPPRENRVRDRNITMKHLIVMIKAWNAWRRGEKLDVLMAPQDQHKVTELV